MLLGLRIFCGFLIVTALPLLPQTSTGIANVSEPPELTGEPKKVVQPTEAERRVAQILPHLKEGEEGKSALPMLDQLIKEHPEYSDAYFLRATLKACLLKSRDFGSIAADVDAAMSYPGEVYNKTDYYSLLGRIAFENGNYQEAIDDLEVAMMRDIDDAVHMFNIEGVEPERTSKFCAWNLTELDELAAKFPTDYRARIYRGLYYEFFTTFKEDYYQRAAQEFQRASLLNPRSALAQYFIGRLSTKASFWTKKAWASDAGRDKATRTAIQSYTRAIQLDPRFLPALEQRASGYLNLKQSHLAIKDFDRVLVLNPEKASAYSDRGIAKMDIGQYFSAISDFGDAIRRETDGSSYLPNL